MEDGGVHATLALGQKLSSRLSCTDVSARTLEVSTLHLTSQLPQTLDIIVDNKFT